MERMKNHAILLVLLLTITIAASGCSTVSEVVTGNKDALVIEIGRTVSADLPDGETTGIVVENTSDKVAKDVEIALYGYDDAGEQIAGPGLEMEIVPYILPGEKVTVGHGAYFIGWDSVPATVEAKVNKVDWITEDKAGIPDLSIEDFQLTDNAITFTARNDSDIDFSVNPLVENEKFVNISIAFRNSDGEIIGGAFDSIQDFAPHTQTTQTTELINFNIEPIRDQIASCDVSIRAYGYEEE